MDHHGSGLFAVAVGFVAGGLLLTYAGQVVGLCVALSGLGALVGRYLAEIRGYGDHETRAATAFGFFIGLLLSASVVVVDVILGAYA